MVPRCITIAGSDSGGGAGIQADLKAFAAAGVHGMSAIVALTAQNTREVSAVHEVPAWFVRAQLDAVAGDIGIDAAKTGMLFSRAIIEAVAEWLEEHPVPLVVDPVMVASSGSRLLEDDADQAAIVAQWLEEAGYTVRVFRTAAEFRRRQGAESIDLLLLD